MTADTPDQGAQRFMPSLIARQVEAIDAWHENLKKREEALLLNSESREERLDADRRREVLRCTTDALVDQTAAQWLDPAPEPMKRTAPVRAVIAHRQPWFATKVSAALAERDVTVVAVTDNGARALGIVVAEQPDLVLVEDTLPMLSGAELLAEMTRFAPLTLAAAQVRHGDRIGPLLDAGAKTVFTRQVPPAAVAAELAKFVCASPESSATHPAWTTRH